MIRLEGVGKTYRLGNNDYQALVDIDLTIGRNEYVALTGASGSGKSTMMNVLGCLDTPSAGRYTLDGEAVAGLDEDQLARVRNRKIGFVFQNFYLRARATALDNVAQPLIYRGISPAQRAAHAREALTRVGLEHRMMRCSSRTNSPAGSANAWRLRVRWWGARSCCWPMNPPAISTAKRRLKSCRCSASCIAMASR
jgi:ABC-type lipoprotein export system ATPase subunit